jgi:hypothetical protein
MSKDFLKKEPTKTEKVLYELMLGQQELDRRVFSNAAHILAVGLVAGLDPEKVAEMMDNDAKIKEYSDKVNAKLKELHEARHKTETKTENSEAKNDEPKAE